MIVGAAVCPGAPLLVPGLAPALRDAVPDLVESCGSALARLSGATRIVLITSGQRARDLGVASDRSTIVHRCGTPVSSTLLTDSRGRPEFFGRLGGSSAESAESAASVDDTDGPKVWPGVGVLVGAALLADAKIDVPTTAIELGDEAEGLDLVCREVDAADDRVGVLVVGDGTASRGPESPGGGHDGAEAFDATLAAALAAGDPLALAAAALAGESAAEALMWTSGPALRALALLTRTRPPTGSTVFYNSAPFGVGYMVAAWTWDDQRPEIS